MAPDLKKRKAVSKDDKHDKPGKANKRRKIQPASKKSAKTASVARSVHLDELGWQAVDIPEQMDDYEGFFGLEEVEGVEVVKDEASGRVEYKTLGSSKPESQSKKPTVEGSDTYETVKSALKEKTDAPSALEEEWQGFSDAEEQDEDEVMEKEPEKKDDNEPEDGSEGSIEEEETLIDAELGTIPFAGLGEEDLDEGVDTSEWQSLDLSPETLSALSKLGFVSPTPIQRSSIPEILAGHDVVGKASTGSGKTLAFGIPILEHYLQTASPTEPESKEDHSPMALIMAPTRELAHQISKHLLALCSQEIFPSGPRMATITGGLSIQKQQRLLASADIVIGTPGRLWEVMSGGVGVIAKMKKIQFLVVDEADRLLSQGHFQEIEQILTALDRVDVEEGDEDSADAEKQAGHQRQTLVFSATFHKGLMQKLAGKGKGGGEVMSKQESMEYLLKKLRFREEKPKFIDMNPESQMATGLKEGLIECAGTEKDLYLYALLLLHPKTRTLVFTNSISAVRRILPFLQNLNQPAQGLHSNMPQKARLRAVERFTSNSSAILIATDVAARGLDIPGVQLVIHYHLPRTADMYVHRSGRTARAEKKGSSVIICAPEEVMSVRRLIAKVHSTRAPAAGTKRFIQSLDIDRRVVARLKPRAIIAKKIADVAIAKEKGNVTDKIFLEAAEDLGVDYDSEEFENGGGGRQGRGNMRKKKEREDRGVGKDQMGAWRAELRELLKQRVNVGVSETYLTGGTVDIDALLKGEKGEFLGMVNGLEMEE